jgi:tRNA pseudouridine38-40 synthase
LAGTNNFFEKMKKRLILSEILLDLRENHLPLPCPIPRLALRGLAKAGRRAYDSRYFGANFPSFFGRGAIQDTRSWQNRCGSFGAFELFSPVPIDLDTICYQVNQYLPPDIRLLEVREVGKDFNIIQDVAWKEYRYNIAFGEKFHPFAGGYLSYFAGNPDIELMQEGLALLKGMHDFRRFCSVDKITDNYVRTILETSFSRHPQAGLGYIPEQSYTMEFKGKGFLRYQVRIMVGALIDLGLGKLSLAEFEEALSGQGSGAIAIQAPAHGLVLEDVVFRNI